MKCVGSPLLWCCWALAPSFAVGGRYDLLRLRIVNSTSTAEAAQVAIKESVANFSNHSTSDRAVVSKELRARLDEWLSHLLSEKSLSNDPKKCAKETDEMMNELHHAYTARMVPNVLRDECDQFIYRGTFGGDVDVCHAIVDHLINTWKGDKDYETWCRDVYSMRNSANATKVPVKEEPKPKKGKYAGVEDWSYPNGADPEKPCHGAVPCNGKGVKNNVTKTSAVGGSNSSSGGSQAQAVKARAAEKKGEEPGVTGSAHQPFGGSPGPSPPPAGQGTGLQAKSAAWHPRNPLVLTAVVVLAVLCAV